MEPQAWDPFLDQTKKLIWQLLAIHDLNASLGPDDKEPEDVKRALDTVKLLGGEKIEKFNQALTLQGIGLLLAAEMAPGEKETDEMGAQVPVPQGTDQPSIPIPEGPDQPSVPKEKIDLLLEALAEIPHVDGVSASFDPVAKTLKITILDPDVNWVFTRLFTRVVRSTISPSRASLVRDASLGLLVTTYENIVGVILREYLARYPNALGSDKAELSLSDLERYGSIEDARKDLVEQRVDRFMRDSVDDWNTWFARHLKVDAESLVPDWEEVREIFARRNVLVHNGGKASAQYLVTTVRSGQKAVPGQVLKVSPEYLDSAVNSFLALTVLLGFYACLKMYPDSRRSASHWVVMLSEDFFNQGLWRACSTVAQRAGDDLAPARRAAESRVVGWFARQKTGETDDVRKEVEDWDTSASGDRFVALRSLLLGDADGAAALLEKMLDTKRITLSEIAFSAMFDQVADRLVPKP